MIQITAVGDENTAIRTCKELLEAIRDRYCSDGAYRGLIGQAPDQYYLRGAITERDTDNPPVPPRDGSDEYIFHPSIDLSIYVEKL